MLTRNGVGQHLLSGSLIASGSLARCLSGASSRRALPLVTATLAPRVDITAAATGESRRQPATPASAAAGQAERASEIGQPFGKWCYRLLKTQKPIDPAPFLGSGSLVCHSLGTEANVLTGLETESVCRGEEKKTGTTPASLTYASDTNQGAVQMTHRGRTLCF